MKQTIRSFSLLGSYNICATFGKNMAEFRVPKDCFPLLGLCDIQLAIKKNKNPFQNHLSNALSLHRIIAPLFVDPSGGLMTT